VNGSRSSTCDSGTSAAVQRCGVDPSLQDAVAAALVPLSQVELRLPFTVADYVDFYASEHHATNVGRLFRPDGDALPAAWKHLPLGRPVPLDDVDEHVFGMVLVNDWSARDVQAFEYVPLGPFLGKSFATSVSPWVVPLSALSHARVPPPPRDPVPLEYLDDTDAEPWGLDVRLSLSVGGHVVSRPSLRTTYWTVAQQVAHLTVNGASLRTGDLLASGTVSGPSRDQRGSLLELMADGPLRLPDGSTRTFLEDGDEVVISATAPGPAGSVLDLGEVRGTVVGPGSP